MPRPLRRNARSAAQEEWCRTRLDEARAQARALQIWRWFYKQTNCGQRALLRAWGDADDSQDGFSRAFVDKAEAHGTLDSGLQLVSQEASADGTRKLLFSCGNSASAQVETVLIPISRSQGQKERVTVCVSSQVGCAMNCQFCYTGRMGLLQNLSTAQIVEQLVEARRIVASDAHSPPVTNIVFMGMGEPLHNLEAVLAAIDIATHPAGLDFSKNKVTVSTVGLVPEIRTFCERSSAQLAVSLHAPTDAIRDWIVPVNRRYPLAQLIATLEELFPKGKKSPTGGHSARHVLFEYVMLRGVNDAPEHARQVLELVRGVECKFNLIVFNPHEGTQFEASTRKDVLAFRSILIQGQLVCTIRDSRGPDEMAACGQLGNPGLARSQMPVLPRPDSV